MKRWPLNKAYFWETIPFFRLLVPLAAGIFLYPFVAAPIAFIITALLLSSAGYAFSAFAKQNTNSIRYISFVCMHLSIVFASWVMCYQHDIRNDKDWFGNTTNDADGYVATITNVPAEKERTWKLEVAVTHSIRNNETSGAKGEAFVYVYKYNAPALHEGDKIIIPNKWQVIKNSGNPFEFDYAAYTARDNIYYQQFISGDEISIHTYADTKDLSWIRRVHHWSVQQLEWYITDRPTLGLLKAILVGDKDLLNNELTVAYANTGIIHIMAISGAHISVFFLLVAALLVWVRHKRYRWVKYIAALPLIWIYVVVAGAPTSAVRAATMFSLLGIGFALQKNPNGVNQLLATAFILLCINPTWLYNVGFQLSFTAVLSIFLFYKWVYRWYSPVNKIIRTIWAAIAVSIAAEILVAPLVIYYYHLFPLQFIIANVLAYLFMSVVLIGGMLLIAVSASYPIAHFVAEVLTSVTTWFNKAIYVLQGMNPASFHRLTLTDLQIILVYGTVATIAVFLIKKNKQALFIGLSTCSLFLFSSCVAEWQSVKQNVFVVYNTSRGNHIELIQGTKCTTLYCPEHTDPKTWQYVLAPAHINMHVRDTLKVTTTYNMIKTGGKTVFILDKPIQDTTLHADYVILTRTKGINLKTIKEVFTPKQIVISSSIPANKAALWATEAERIGLQVHNIRRDGAFMMRY